ncbi:Histone chaperone asf1 [Coemansia sp. RSA 562]|nr:Histone chaperone asf1 [Coemansia sp. RSA 1938]KAJ2140724.1 Histone chaperone asf1 [Coemansia sp. RSA 564]KAJ2157109.1 Histone chaperone asf1 [Coemansia sp. RSA 562]KAJ2269161.1 Histone chaperone asf1 [Coemansia sp. RSA 370]KAJ2285294.1 Histone chaperone asf1 [Coemansia sp. RSA 355]KAJ2408735.1 Histone chaperone asf1 [Coemansia sp. RSA 2526]KAJ2524333.1 Histone chaperone asf1 [Coemansia sp. RSA 1937]
MSLVKILNVNILNPTANFLAPYKFEITFECIEQLKDDLEFKLIYVWSAKSSTLDQELDSLLVGPVPMGINKFVFEADAPDVSKIPKEDLLDVSVILLTCSYMEKMFTRIGYYVNNAYTDGEMQAAPPATPQLDKVQRSILADKPRVTQFAINWDDPTQEEQPPVESVEAMMAGESDGELDNDDEDDELDEDEELEEDDVDGDEDLDETEAQDEAELDDEDLEEADQMQDDDDEMAVEDGPTSMTHSAMPHAVGMEIE